MVEAVVEYDYKAKEDDELTLKKGDIISDITKKPGGWWEGTLARVGKRGMFPDNYVKVLGGGDKKIDSSQRVGAHKCKVLFSYTPTNVDELELHVGDIIDIIGEVEEGWWKGKLKNKIGVFPSNFVTELTEGSTNSSETRKARTSIDESTKQSSGSGGNQEIKLNESGNSMSSTKSDSKEVTSSEGTNNEALPALPPKPTKEICRVMFPYTAANDDELTLEEGDIITIISKDAADEGWWTGELKGKIGVFPDNFVKLFTVSEEPKPERPPVKTIVKGKDSITKSSSSASVYSVSSAVSNASVMRKHSDSVRYEEKSIPPSIGKKPVLPPPPLKKPTLSPNTAEAKTSKLSEPDLLKLSTKQTENEVKTVSSKLTDSSPTTGTRSFVHSVVSSVSKQNSGGESKWTVVETSDSHDGISWSRQSYSVSSSSNTLLNSSSNNSSGALNNGNVLNNGNSSSNIAPSAELDLDMIGRAPLLPHPTASRAKVPKRRPPSTVAREDSRESAEPEGLLNGNVELMPEKPASKAPWVEELKLSQAKKSLLGGGKTRVMIGGGENESEKGSVTLRQTPITSQRPLSLHTRIPEAPSTNSSTETINVPLIQWNDLCSKVMKLEAQLESQREDFKNTIKEILETIDAQSVKQRKIMNELEKLTDLVTQV